MKKILFPTDFSPAAHQAFRYALRMAESLSAEITALHVYEMPVADYMDTPGYLLDVYSAVERSSFENFRSQLPQLEEIAREEGLSGIPLVSALHEGDLVQAILQLNRERPFDLIVMGTQGATGVVETFFGTSTARVMADAKSNVLAVPEQAEYRNIRKIVFTTRFLEEDVKALERLLQLAHLFGAQVDCLHIQADGHQVKEVVLADWRLRFQAEHLNFHVVHGQDIEKEILDFMTVHGTDLVAIRPGQHGFFEGIFHSSLTQKLAFHSQVPVLAIH